MLRFGSSGSGGVINVIDGRIPTEIPESTEASARIGFSSVDSGKEGAASIKQNLGNNLVLHLRWNMERELKIIESQVSLKVKFSMKVKKIMTKIMMKIMMRS